MKRLLALFAVCCVMIPAAVSAEGKKEAQPATEVAKPAAQEAQPATEAAEPLVTPGLETLPKKLGYVMGVDAARQFKAISTEIGSEVDLDAMFKAIKAVFDGEELLLTQEEMVKIQQELTVKRQEKQQKEFEAMKAKNKVAGDAYLAENKAKEGVMVTESGLQYSFITKGDGPMPSLEDQVKVHYAGTTIDGNEFDSSYKRGEPIVFGLNGVIPGWTEALQLLPVGSKARLVIPSELAYGERGVPPAIEPNSVLVFEVELLEIVKKEEEATEKKEMTEKKE